MPDKIWITIAGQEFWVEGGEFEEMLYAVRDRLQSKFKSRPRAWIVKDSPHDAAALLRPFRLIKAIGESDRIGELVAPSAP